MSEYSGDGEVWMDTPDDHGGYSSDESWEEAVPASRLPDGTVVARQRDVWIKSHPDDWHSTFCSHDMDSYVDFVLSKGARVLRYGYDGSSDE